MKDTEMEEGRSINWLESARRALRGAVPATAEYADSVSSGLAQLMLERLPAALRETMVGFLPDDEELPHPEHNHPAHGKNVGFTEFVDRARHDLGLTDILDSKPYEDSEQDFENLCTEVVRVFLWSVAHQLPPDFKTRMLESLPADLCSRMDLYCAHSAQDQVA
jgi:hypothetical protein